MAATILDRFSRAGGVKKKHIRVERVDTPRLTNGSLSNATLPCIGDIATYIPDGHDGTQESKRNGGAGDSGSCETSERLGR